MGLKSIGLHVGTCLTSSLYIYMFYAELEFRMFIMRGIYNVGCEY